MKRYGEIAAAFLCVATPFAGHAADEWGGELRLTSDYVFRGLSMTRGDPAVQADLHWNRDGRWLAGLWGSTVDPNTGPGPTLELNLYAGFTWNLNPDWLARLIAVHYEFLGEPEVLLYDYDEAVASLAFRERVIMSVGWSPNVSAFANGRLATDRTAVSYELAAQFPWRQEWLASASAGYYDLDDVYDRGYAFWSCGVTYSNAPWQVSLARIGTDSRAGDLYGAAIASDRWSLGVQWQFRGAVQ